MELKKRPGKSPKELGVTDGDPACPDIWETAAGDFVVIGTDVTDTVNFKNTDANVGTGERIVVIPRATLLSAVQGLKEEKL